jgi:hypothetical protein
MAGKSAFLLPLAIAFSTLSAISLLMWLFPPAIWFSTPRDRCPNCESKDIRRSMVTTIPDRLRMLFRLQPFRCRACWNRFPAKADKMTGVAQADWRQM